MWYVACLQRPDSTLADFVESLKEQSLFKAIACSDYIRKDQLSWLQLKVYIQQLYITLLGSNM